MSKLIVLSYSGKITIVKEAKEICFIEKMSRLEGQRTVETKGGKSEEKHEL